MLDGLEAFFRRYVDPTRDGKALPVTGRGQRDLVTPDRQEANAFSHNGHYLDPAGHRREANWTPPALSPPFAPPGLNWPPTD
jgi:hypothetical protein